MTIVKTKPNTKSAAIIALLKRSKGASLDEVCKATNWKPHSARAFLTGLRKKGFMLAREQHSNDAASYRITQMPVPKTQSAES